jgi:catechol 2,3-dioxygenase-like lactoylglutathione lyase family enzyme
MNIDVRGMTPLIQVFDMPTSLAFYCDVLGFEVHASSQQVPNCGWAWLKLNGIDLMLNTAYEDEYRPASPDTKRVAAHDDTCLYFGCPDVDAAYEYFVSKGIDVKPPKVAPYGMKQLYLHDPDGFNLCFQWSAKPEA